MWFSCGFHVAYMWFSCGFCGFSKIYPALFCGIKKGCGFHVAFMWFSFSGMRSEQIPPTPASWWSDSAICPKPPQTFIPKTWARFCTSKHNRIARLFFLSQNLNFYPCFCNFFECCAFAVQLRGRTLCQDPCSHMLFATWIPFCKNLYVLLQSLLPRPLGPPG